MEPQCGACEAERPRRYEAFVSLVWISTRKHEIVRMTKNAMFQLKSALDGESSPRGRVIQLERKTGRANGRVVCTLEPVSVEVARLPAPPQLEEHLSRIWRVDGIQVTKDEQSYVRQLGVFVAESIEKGRAKNG